MGTAEMTRLRSASGLRRAEERLSSLLGVPFAMELSFSGNVGTANDASSRRAIEWANGRRALARVLKRLKLGSRMQARGLQFPHPQLSLSHSQNLAIAVGVELPFVGVGVDFEFNRPVNPRAAKLFLSENERRRLQLPTSATLLQMWTVKEALFKSDPNNGENWILRYETKTPRRCVGLARKQSGLGGCRFQYASFAAEDGVISVAVCLRR